MKNNLTKSSLSIQLLEHRNEISSEYSQTRELIKHSRLIFKTWASFHQLHQLHQLLLNFKNKIPRIRSS